LTALVSGVAVAGAVAWCVDVGVLYVGHTYGHLPTAAAAAAGFVIGAVVNFALNRWLFRAHGAPAHRQMGRYALLFLANLALVTVLVPLLATWYAGLIHAPARLLLAKVTVTAALLPANLWAYRAWVFKV